MSGGSSANNSWTLLTPEEPVTETLRPLAEGTEHHEVTSAIGSTVNKPISGAESADGLAKEGYQVSEENPAELSGDTSTEQHTSMPTTLTDAAVPTTLKASYSFAPDNDALSQSEGLPEGPAQSGPDPDSFSDSYTHITPSPDEPPASLLSTETLGGEELAQEGTLYQLNGERLQHEGVEADLCQRKTDVGKQAEVGEQKPVKTAEEGEPELRRRRSLLAALERIGRTEEEEEKEEEFQLPQREEHSGLSVNKCILGAVILLGLGTIFFSESDYGTRELKDAELPGKQEWLNPEGTPSVEVDSTELLNKLAKGNQQISVLQAQLEAQKEELKVAKGQAAEGAKERLRWEEVEKENSRLKKEMASVPVLQKENQRMKRELESVPALQQELETLRATVTEFKLSPAASEATQAPVKAMTSPPSGQQEERTYGTAESTERQLKKPWKDQRENNKDLKKDKKDMGEKEEKERKKSQWKEREKKEHKDGGKPEWKKEKLEQAKFDKEKHNKGKQKRYSDETKQWNDKDWKKGKASRGDEGKLLKDREGNEEWKEKSERKEWKGEKEWKKAKHEEGNEDKQWRGKKERKDWKVGKEHGEKHNSREEWKGGKQLRTEKDGYTTSGKEKGEKKGWKEKGEKQEWKKDGDWKRKNGEDHRIDRKWKGETKQWEESNSHGKERKGNDEGKHWNKGWKSKNGNSDEEWKRKNERKQWNENEWKSKTDKYEKDRKRTDEREQGEKKEEQWKRGGQKDKKDWDKDRSSSQKHKDEHKFTADHGHEWGDRKPSHTHRHPSLQQPEYWVKQRNRLQHNPKPPQHCDSLETCAQTEGLLPVPLPEFEAFLQTYLTKAEEVGVDASIREELKKLASEFFKDGVFVHDQMSFQDFAEDLEDVLEDMVEGDDYEEEEDSAIEEEMEGFEREVMKRFSLPGAGKKEERPKGEWRKESGRGRG